MQRIIYRRKHKKFAKLSIITVVKDDYLGLLTTANSVSKYVIDKKFIQYIIWINFKSEGIIANIHSIINLADVIVVGDDSGIFDAMNKSLEFSYCRYILFLNAKDYFCDYFDASMVTQPSLISVKYVDYFGKCRHVNVSSNISNGFPYCHQGLILPRHGYWHDTDYLFGAEYKALIDLNIKWPFPRINTGLIFYDTTGVSSVNRFINDIWLSKIVYEHYGLINFFRFSSISIFKLTVKRIYDIFKL